MTKAETSFGAWLKSRRKTLDLTQDELAQQVGCATVTIRKIEANALKPSMQVAQRLALCCRVPEGDQEAFVRFARSEGPASHVWVDKTPGAPPVTFETDRPANNLVDLPNPLIGRDQDVADIRQRLLGENVRLLSLIGPPGVGKTRLAQQVANEVLEHFRDGVFLVWLAPVSSPQQVLVTIAHVLGLKESGINTLSHDLKDFLYDKELLLVLDNFEQVLGAAPAIDALLQSCYGVKALVTSREGLHLRRERRFNVAPLPLPNAENIGDRAAFLANPAVALFVERAQAGNSSFEVDANNAADIAAVCVQLDGLPLSIELIAARSMLLSPKAMLRHLDHQLAVLTSKSFDHPQRQRTLRDAIRWSYNLLDGPEQELFARLGVFPASFTLAAAEAIGDPADLPWSALDGLAALVDKSLLVSRTDVQPEMRFEMLQVLREYARESLGQHPRQTIFHQDHADYYLGMARTIRSDLHGVQQCELILQVEQETYNLQAALRWFLDNQQIARAMELASALSDYWHIRGYSTEGRRWFDHILAAADATSEPIPDQIRIEMLNAAGFLAYHQSDYAISQQLFSRSLPLIEQSDERTLLARVFNNLGLIAQWQGDFAKSHDLMQRSLEIWRSLNLGFGVANAIGNLGALAQEFGDYQAARRYFDESLALWREMGVKRGLGNTLVNLGSLAIQYGQLDLALARLDEGLSFYRDLGNKTGIGLAETHRARVFVQRGSFTEAEEALACAIELGKETGSKHLLSQAFRECGRLALEQNQFARAETLYRDSLALSDVIGYARGSAANAAQLALLALRRGQPADGLELARSAIERFEALGQLDGMIGAVEILALLLGDSDPERALRLWSYAEDYRATHQIPRLPLDEAAWDGARASLLDRLGPAAYAALSATCRQSPVVPVLAELVVGGSHF